MRFKVGDRVKFLNDIGGGVVVRITHKTLYVENQDGFEIPVSEQEILLDLDNAFGSESKSLVQKSLPDEFYVTEPSETENFPEAEHNPSAQAGDTNCSLWFSWVLQRAAKCADLYLINDSSYQLLYTVSTGEKGAPYQYSKAGRLEDGFKELMGSFSHEMLLRNPILRCEGILFKPGRYEAHAPVLFEFFVDTKTLFDPKSHVANDYFDEKALLISIYQVDEPLRISKEILSDANTFITTAEQIKPANGVKNIPHQTPAQAEGPKIQRNTLSDDENVIDLHIELLVENSENLTPGEILDIQMARFKISLESAIVRKTPKLIYIHGVGNGKLRYTLRKTLEREYPKIRFQDASFKEYGYGATMLFLK